MMLNALHSHVLEIAAGSDVVLSLFNYAQRRGQGICILSGNGVVTQVTLRQSTGRILSLKGRFQILSISGTILPSPMMSQGAEGLSIYLSRTLGEVVGGNVVAPLTASGSVVLMVACFADAKIVKLPLVICDEDEEESSGSTVNATRKVVEGGDDLVEAIGSTTGMRNMLSNDINYPSPVQGRIFEQDTTITATADSPPKPAPRL